MPSADEGWPVGTVVVFVNDKYDPDRIGVIRSVEENTTKVHWRNWPHRTHQDFSNIWPTNKLGRVFRRVVPE